MVAVGLTVMALVVELFDHKYVEPPDAVNVVDVVIQFNVALDGVMDGVGGALLTVTVCDAVAVQPEASETVTV